MTKGKDYSQAELDAAVEKYLGGMKLNAVCNTYLNVPERTITCLAKAKSMELKENNLDLR
jgi:exonuclease VII small subunit